MNASLVLLSVVMQLARLVEQRPVQGGREEFIGVLSVRLKVFVARSLGSDLLCRLERFEQGWFFCRSLLSYDFVEINYLFIIYRAA